MSAVAANNSLFSKNQNITRSLGGNVCGNMALPSNHHEHVRGGVNKAFSSCLLFYAIRLNTYMSFKRLWSDFVIVLRGEWGDGFDYVM